MNCGLIASSTMAGCNPAGSWSRAVARVAPRAWTSPRSRGAGSTTNTWLPGTPRDSQPRSNAPPILPQPTSRSGPGKKIFWSLIESLGLSDRLQHGGFHRLMGLLTAPQCELEGRVETLAFADRGLEQILQLLGDDPTGSPKQHGMAVHRRHRSEERRV